MKDVVDLMKSGDESRRGSFRALIPEDDPIAQEKELMEKELMDNVGFMLRFLPRKRLFRCKKQTSKEE